MAYNQADFTRACMAAFLEEAGLLLSYFLNADCASDAIQQHSRIACFARLSYVCSVSGYHGAAKL